MPLCRPSRNARKDSASCCTSSIGPQLQGLELSREAIRLTRAVYDLLPEDGEVAAAMVQGPSAAARLRWTVGPLGTYHSGY